MNLKLTVYVFLITLKDVYLTLINLSFLESLLLFLLFALI